MSARLLLALAPLALFACTDDPVTDGTDDSDVEALGYEPDPHVDTFVPDGYRPVDPVRVVFLGDSITNGVGASDGPLAYTSLLVDNAADSGQPT